VVCWSDALPLRQTLIVMFAARETRVSFFFDLFFFYHFLASMGHSKERANKAIKLSSPNRPNLPPGKKKTNPPPTPLPNSHLIL
jgi:hypothetical protein